MPETACDRCNRSLLDLRSDLSIEQLRGSQPLCSVPGCPLVQDVQGFTGEWEVSGDTVLGPSPPNVFVGRHGYPDVQVGPLLPPGTPDDAAVLESPSNWVDRNIVDVLGLRSNLVRSKAKVDVRRGLDETESLDVSRELAMARRPVDTELAFDEAPDLDLSPRVDRHAAPTGPSVRPTQARITTNPSVPRRVDQIVSDTDAKAATGVSELYDAGIDGYQIKRLLSTGLLGQEQRRRLVPTRWSITATDDMIGKDLREEAKGRATINSVEVYHHRHFGNHFWVLLLPRVWSFEMLESWEQEAGSWVTIRDHEPHGGRTSYAEDVTGAYYAARLPVLEDLARRRRQAAPLVVREITDAYFAPLGVWVIREGVRKAMENRPRTFGHWREAVQAMRARTHVDGWPEESWLLDRVAHQTRLEEYT